MYKTIKKILISCLSILGLSLVLWLTFLFNPSLSYAHKTEFGQITVYHNQALATNTENILNDAFSIIKTADLFDPNIQLDLCLNDGTFYPELWPLKGATAYSFLDKGIIYASQPNFNQNITSFKWAVNGFEPRTFNLTWLLAHEFTHCLQYNWKKTFPLHCAFWRSEGYAEYISRQFKNDGRLNEKIEQLALEEQKEHHGIPVFKLEDGTVQNLFYFKSAVLVQYLIEVEKMDFPQIVEDNRTIEVVREQMENWAKNN